MNICDELLLEIVSKNGAYQIIWWFPSMMVPQNGWLIMETPMNMDDLGVPL